MFGSNSVLNNSLNIHAKASRAYKSKSKNYTSRRCSLLEAKKEYLEEIYDDILEQNLVSQQIIEQEEQIIRRLILDDVGEKLMPRVGACSIQRKGMHLGEIVITLDPFDKIFLEMKHVEKIVDKLRQKYIANWAQEKKISFGYGVHAVTDGKISFTASLHCYTD